jgi:ribosomal protein S18 acetylase RimI-like enzyme
MITVEAARPADLVLSDVLALYDSVGWMSYTRNPGLLQAALRGSSTVVHARDGGQLVGLARVVSDNASICYLQDILVHPAHQGQGIGRALARTALGPYGHIRQKVLLTDGEAQQKAFYEPLGYVETSDYTGGVLHAFVRFD